MIGVLSKATETAAVEEFFQLFKTPWEFFRADRAYDVVVATADNVPEVNAGLLLIYSSDTVGVDRQTNALGCSRSGGVMLDFRGKQLPIYGAVRAFKPIGTAVLNVHSGPGIAGVRLAAPGATVYRFGYDLFQEVAFLLTAGQPVERAHTPTLDLHIDVLRSCLKDEGIPFLEIPPVPAGYDFVVCLTHDIDFVGIRRHRFDHTMWGFLYRSLVGGLRDFVRGRISVKRLTRMWRAVVSLPFVYLGWMKDYWLPFDWYLQIEKGLGSTYFLIPFKRRTGDRVAVGNAKRRAAAYDVTDLPDWTGRLIRAGCEIGVHGIDAWHSVDKGRAELERVNRATGQTQTGIRMHWLLRDEDTYRVLEEAGYRYDSTAGYNDTVGYCCGTTQVFRPLDAHRMLELPLHVQDGALFFRQRLDLSEPDAWEQCMRIIASAKELGGVVTLLWHDRSHGPERFWGDFYARLVRELKLQKVWFAQAGEAVDWFQKRRQVSFAHTHAGGGSLRVSSDSRIAPISPPLVVRIHRAHAGAAPSDQTRGQVHDVVDFAWTGETEQDLHNLDCSRPQPVCQTAGLLTSAR